MKSMVKPFDIQYDQIGFFNILVYNKPIFGERLMARIGRHQAIVTSIESRECSDNNQTYVHWTIGYASPVHDDRKFTGHIKIYEDHVIFETVYHFRLKGKNKKHMFGHPYIAFPSFEGMVWQEDLTCISYKRQGPFSHPLWWKGKVLDSLRDGKNLPLIITNEDGESLVLSPLSHLLVGSISISHNKQCLQCGIPRAVKEIEEETIFKVILTFGQGVINTLERWGQIMRNHYSIEKISLDNDVSLKYISYWTNAGSKYWYKTLKGKSYIETLEALKKHHKKIGLNFASYQLDSWWYKKEGDSYTSGIVEWEPKSVTKSKNFNSMLPFLQKYKDINVFDNQTMTDVHKVLEKPIGCHFKQLANESVYVKKNHGDYNIEGYPLPKNEELTFKLFSEIFKKPSWGLAYIVHDWLQFMSDNHTGFKSIKQGEDYFKGLDKACLAMESEDNVCGHLALQLCMTQPQMNLFSVRMQSVSSIRSTPDSNSFFIEGPKRWWWHLYTSVYINALGKYPYYDNRRSKRKACLPLRSQVDFEFIWLSLSCGPIGIGDALGQENMPLIRRLIKYDGEIIKPDQPCRPIEKNFLQGLHLKQNKLGTTVYTSTKIPLEINRIDYKKYDELKIVYVLCFNTNPIYGQVGLEIQDNDFGISPYENFCVYDYLKGSIAIHEKGLDLVFTLKRRAYKYFIISPIKKGFAFIGDITKYVCASTQLVKDIQIDQEKIKVTIKYVETYGYGIYAFFMSEPPIEVKLDGKKSEFDYRDNLLKVKISYNAFISYHSLLIILPR